MSRVWQDRIVQYPGRFTIVNNGDGTSTLTPTPGTITQVGTPVNAAMLNGIESDLSNITLLSDDVKGTIAYPTIVNNQITQINHKNGSTIIRSDVFTYEINLITEVRTLISTGDTITLKYHLDTLQTEVI